MAQIFEPDIDFKVEKSGRETLTLGIHRSLLLMY
jgi:hypothetical protein